MQRHTVSICFFILISLIQLFLTGAAMNEYKELLGLIDEQERWRGNCLNMIASENVTSDAVQRAVASDFGHRYAEGILGGEVDGVHIFERFYQGTRVFDRVEHLALKLSKEVFHAEHANVVPISGAVANLVAYKALAKYGDRISGLSIPAGAIYRIQGCLLPASWVCRRFLIPSTTGR